MEQQLEEVISWLEAGDAADYQAGVLLFQQHCRNRSLVTNLLKKESAAHREKLRYELVKVGCQGRMEDVSEVMNHFARAVQAAVPQLAEVPTRQEFSPQPDPGQVPNELRPQVDELTQLLSRVYNQRCQLSNSLAELDPGDGPRVVGEILALEQQYNTLAQKRQNVLADQQPTALAEEASSGQAPFEQPASASEPGLDRAGLVQRRNTLRSGISKARKKAEESKTEEKRSEYAQKAAKLQVELDQVEMQLKS